MLRFGRFSPVFASQVKLLLIIQQIEQLDRTKTLINDLLLLIIAVQAALAAEVVSSNQHTQLILFLTEKIRINLKKKQLVIRQ